LSWSGAAQVLNGQREDSSSRGFEAGDQMQILLKQVPKVKSLESLLGLEGNLAALYFGALPFLISEASELHFSNQSPAKDQLMHC